MSVKLEWEGIDSTHERAKVIGGWIVKSYQDVSYLEFGERKTGFDFRESMVFIPDPIGEWGNR